MTEQEIAELVERLREQTNSYVCAKMVDISILMRSADLIEAQQAALALCERRAEEAESRVTFYDVELLKTSAELAKVYDALVKISDELRILKETGK